MSTPILTRLSAFWRDEERFKEMLSILIAVTTLLTVVVGLLQNDASAKDDRANREAQTFALRAMGLKVAGQAQVGYDEADALRNWTELQTLAQSAEVQGDEAAARRYRAVAERITALSSLLAPPYFDPASSPEPSIASYETVIYLEQVTELHERFLAKFAEKQAWDTKANTYVVHLTILAVSLFLFGLSATIGSKVRWVFVAAGLPVTLLAVIWAAVIYFAPVPSLPDPAIKAFARGYGLYYQGQLEEAVAAFDEALAVKPSYTNALYWRGVAHYDQAVYRAADDAEATGYYQDAAASYASAHAALAQARDAGVNDTDLKENDVVWDLSWTYYVLGDFDKAVQLDDQILKQDETDLGIRFNLGLALLAQGQIDAAKEHYKKALEMATQQVASAQQTGQQPLSLWQMVGEVTAGRQLPGSLWWNLEYAANDLDALIDRLDGYEASDWSQSPPLDKIQQPDLVRAAAWELLQEVKSNRVALETTGQPPAGSLNPDLVVELEFGQAETSEEDGEEVLSFSPMPEGIFPPLTDEFVIRVGYEGMQDGQKVLVKIYHEGDELTYWRASEDWDSGPSGEWFYPVSYAYSDVSYFEPGEYSVEFYVDYRLAAREYFFIEAEQAQ